MTSQSHIGRTRAIELPSLAEVEGGISFSVVINTDNRIEWLKRTLAGLRYSTYSNFEVCVVAGPTPDGTREYLRTLGDAVKVGYCPVRVLSKSRNIGIAMARGDVVCFIDDDAVPEAEWLEDLASAYLDPGVGAAGGFVYDNTGVNFQARYVTTDRLGYSANWDGPAPHLNFPYSADYPHLLGTNCSFRRTALLEIGGFDEEFEYFLDETDVCCRINDAGYRIVQLDKAFVHHKYAPSHLRDEQRIVRHWYPLIKNRVYFALRNGSHHFSKSELLQAGLADSRGWQSSVEQAARDGLYTPEEVDRFYLEVETALIDGQTRAAEPAKLISEETRAAFASSFQPYPLAAPAADRSVICLVTQDYPPGQNGGIARNMFHLARGLAANGAHVHVLTKARGASTVDFEDGVWVHRLAMRHFPPPSVSPVAPLTVPSHIWNYCETMLEEVRAINAKRKVDVVYCPLWDCEPLGFVLTEEFPLIVALQTTMKFWLESQPLKAADDGWMSDFGHPILAMEKLILERAPMLHANSHAIVTDIRSAYNLPLPPDRLFHSPHGMDDWTLTHPLPDHPQGTDATRLLFVGRLESRKGIDTLLAAAPSLLEKYPAAVIDIVGDDTILRPDGTTYKAEFLAQPLSEDVRRRVRFHGRVEEKELLDFYRDCDIFVAPSRYESFGLVFLEAMVFGKPVVACAAGGAVEVVSDGETGILIPPEDSVALLKSLDRLVGEVDLRQAMGRAGRSKFESAYTSQAMVNDFNEALTRMKSR